MASYRDLLNQVKAEIREVDAAGALELHESDDAPLFVDVREHDEWNEGHIPGAVHVPRGFLESRIEGVAPDRDRPLVIYCAGGSRSAFAAKSLDELGYSQVVSLAGGYTDWKRNGFATKLPVSLDPARRARYSRHLLIPEVGEEGQLKLLDSRVLLIGAGGLGSPASLYLAAAGVGTLGIVDADVVDESNLQRQIVHSTDHARPLQGRLGEGNDRGAEPRRRGGRLPRAPHLGEHRADPRRRLGRDRRRRRQLPDSLPRQRRLCLARHPGRARLDLSLRGPGHRLQAARRPVLSLPLPRSRRRRSSRRAAPRAACSECCRGSSARSRPTRR